jgi:hypothetical protein
MGVRGRLADSEQVEAAWASAGRDAAGGCIEQRFEGAWLSICGPDDCLRADAGDRAGERPPGELLPLQAGGAKLVAGDTFPTMAV